MFVTKVIQLCSLMDQLFKALSIHFSLLSRVSAFSHGYWTVYIMYMDHISNIIRYVGNHFINCLYRKSGDIQYTKIGNESKSNFIFQYMSNMAVTVQQTYLKG